MKNRILISILGIALAIAVGGCGAEEYEEYSSVSVEEIPIDSREGSWELQTEPETTLKTEAEEAYLNLNLAASIAASSMLIPCCS